MVDNQEKKGMNKKWIATIAVAAVIVIGGGYVALFGAGGLINGIGAGNSDSQATQVSSVQGVVKIPLSNITNTLSFYTYNSNGTAIKFFAVKGSDGNVHVAFDACDVCGPKGYQQSGSDLVCNNCHRHFAINSIGTANVNGGCNPAYLPMSISGNFVVIKTSDLVTKESTFQNVK